MSEVKPVTTLKAQKLSKSVLSQANLLKPIRTVSKKVNQQSVSTSIFEDKSDNTSFILNMTHDDDRKMSLRHTEQFTDIELQEIDCNFKKKRGSEAESKSDNGILIHSLCDLFQQITDLK